MNEKKSKPNAFAGYLLGLFVVLFIIGIMRFQTIKSLAHDIFAPRYETADELISHGADSLKTSVPAYFVHEAADVFTCLIVNYPGKDKLSCAPEDILITGNAENIGEIERFAGRKYAVRVETIADMLQGVPIRDNTIYNVKNYNGEYNCFLFDFTMSKEAFMTICDTGYFMDMEIPDNGGQDGKATVAIDVYGNICFISYEQESDNQTPEKIIIGFTR